MEGVLPGPNNSEGFWCKKWLSKVATRKQTFRPYIGRKVFLFYIR